MVIAEFSEVLLKGLVTTLQITVCAVLLACAVSLVAGICRLSRHAWVRWPFTIYVEFFRGTSCYVQMFWLFFSLPLFGIYLDAFLVGVIAIGLNVGSFGSEVVRGAVQAVPRDQIEAAIALNYTRWQRLRHVVLPQAVVRMLPPLANLMIELVKVTPLVSLISIADLTFYAQLIRQQTGETFQAFGTLLVVYFLISSTLAWIFRKLETRMSRGLEITTVNQ
jgi:polar amino acid transport system permease protein